MRFKSFKEEQRDFLRLKKILFVIGMGWNFGAIGVLLYKYSKEPKDYPLVLMLPFIAFIVFMIVAMRKAVNESKKIF